IYTSAWYNDSNRDDGGYSLERINPELPCSDQNNWRACIAQQGGTPGQVNSVLDTSPDITSPEPISVTLNGAQQIIIQFSETVDLSSIDEGDIIIEPEASIVGYGQAQADQISVNLDSALDSGIIYTVTVIGIEDCVGNEGQLAQQFNTAVPQQFQEGDLIINEVLFNPRTGGFDFVEIYNRSDRALSLKNWKMANRESGEIANILTITRDEILILPAEFKVITEDPQDIGNNYPLGRSVNFIETDDLPSYGDDEGYVILVDPVIEIHDEFFYNEDYHFSLIDELDGVSLERIDYERLTNDPTNWHSAAESVGWATPGYENSQLQPANVTSESFSIDPEVFSPDNDGFQDVLNISYALEKPGYVANISIYDRDGRRIRMLVRNELLATKGTISWDGINDDGAKARIGVYVLFIEIFDQNGNVSSTKKTAVLGGRL
ncbi:MAG: hypothetical protein HKO93_02080, partial [Flavobacteriales bacterium]|nr:hypothetical protein [Flavobacteriales bacterium]